VLDTGYGIPVSLSTVWIEVARRLKWPVYGVSLPGHFIVRFDDPERTVLVSPFDDGCTLSIADCHMLIKSTLGDDIESIQAWLRPVDNQAILMRTLTNLRYIYLSRDDLPRAANTLRRMAAIEPGNGQHLQDLAAVCARLGDMRGAYAHLQLYLHRVPNGDDSHIVQRNLQQLHAALTARN
jgi:regulator of sirC expression with transglutaminase-like and TPR domain